MKNKQILILVSLFLVSGLFAQKAPIVINVENIPVTEVLEQLKENYNLHLSYSGNQLEKYSVTIHKTFATPHEALKEIVDGLPYKIEQSDEVFIIVPIKKTDLTDKANEKLFTISGQILEAGTYEPLPFSSIQVNNNSFISNFMGTINYSCPVDDDSIRIKISHLGYYVYDTILYASIDKKFLLIPSNYTIEEVLVSNSFIEKSTQFGEDLAKMKLNQNITGYLPSQGDNAVFNVLRLMPGIQAGSEQTSEPLTWGSYEGQTRIVFDGFLLFGLKSYNDNISAVNPLLVKNIEVFKSGYSAKYSNQVGGLINITGRNGNFKKPAFCLSINPTTLNAIGELPIGEKSSIIMAYRQTYYNIYNSDDFNIFGSTTYLPDDRDDIKSYTTNTDLNVSPESYLFRDFNVKYSVNTGNGDLFQISYYNGYDNFKLASEANLIMNQSGGGGGFNNQLTVVDTVSIDLLSTEETQQYGLSALYGKNWENGSSSKFIVSYSGFQKIESEDFESELVETRDMMVLNSSTLENQAKEFTVQQENQINYSNSGNLSLGACFILDQASYVKSFDQNESSLLDTISSSTNKRCFAYVHNSLVVFDKLRIESGLHANYVTSIGQLNIEPRFSSMYNLTDALKASISWGLYNQYLYKQETVNEYNYYSKQWIASGEDHEPLKAVHYVVGLHYFKNNYTINIEGYRKNIHNLSRVFYVNKDGEQIISEQNSVSEYKGKGKAFGMDILLKKDWKQHTVWASYTLSKTLESFDDTEAYRMDEFSLAPHDQRHEFKIAGLVNFGKWYLSANYVYGSGMQILKTTFPDENVVYNRIDAAITYRFTTKLLKLESGISILNLLNTKNYKYANLKSINVGDQFGTINVYTNAVPFTPTLFLKVQF